MFKESVDSDLFLEFVLHLVRIMFLVPGDTSVKGKSARQYNNRQNLVIFSCVGAFKCFW